MFRQGSKQGVGLCLSKQIYKAADLSIQAIAWVLDNSDSTKSARHVLISIANHCDKYGEDAYPKIQTVMEEAHLSKREVIRSIIKLEKSGELFIERGMGKIGRHRYSLPQMLGAKLARDRFVEGAKSDIPKVPNSSVEGAKSGNAIRKNRPEPSLNPTVLKPETGIDVFQAAKKIQIECGLSGMEALNAIQGAVESYIHFNRGSPEETADALIALFFRYDRAQIAYKVGPSKFFKEGKWRNPNAWTNTITEPSKAEQRAIKNAAVIGNSLGISAEPARGSGVVLEGNSGRGDEDLVRQLPERARGHTPSGV